MNEDIQDPNREWHIARGERKYGPVQIEILRRGLDTGAILPSDFVWSPGLPDWIPITDAVSPNLGSAKRPPLKEVDEAPDKTDDISEESEPDGKKFSIGGASSWSVSYAEGVPKCRAQANRILTVLRTVINHVWKAAHTARNDVWRRVQPFKAVETARVPLSETLRASAFRQGRGQGEVLRNEDQGGAPSIEDRVKEKIVWWAKAVTLFERRKNGNATDRLEEKRFGRSETEQDPLLAIRKLNFIGFALVVFLVGGAGGWAATSQLAGAVIAPGTVVVESNIKKVQHPSGGVVGEILVREGSVVEEGQIVLRLDDTMTRATLGVVRSQLDELMAREARLLAEREEAERIVFSPQIASRRNEPSLTTALAGEEKLFESRRSARTGQRAQLRERVAQMGEEIRGLSAQQASKEAEIALIGKELVGVADLYEKNLVSISRFTQLQRDQTRLHGERGQLIADVARVRGKISETELQIIQLDQDFRTEVLKDLRDAQGRIAELKERVTAAEDQLKRVDLRAPQSGVVHQLAMHTVGGVIGNGETIMQIVPRADELMVEAKIAPQDIDQVELGTKVSVRIMAGNQRTTPEVTGVVTRVSADLTRDQPGGQTAMAYYTVRITLPADQIARLKDIRLLPGMPAEAHIQTSERTPLQYLLKPLEEQIARTFRER